MALLRRALLILLLLNVSYTQLILKLIATIESSYFSQPSVVRNFIPYFPVRIYANEELKTSIFISEISIDPSLYFFIGNTMLNWAKDNECDLNNWLE